MKRCPECRRDYHDETLNFCLDDGAALIDGPATESTTQVLPETKTRLQIGDTDMGTAPSTTSSGEFVISAIRRNKIGAVIASLVLLVVIVGFGYGILSFFKDRGANTPPTRAEASSLKMQPLAASGNIREAAISPDGKFLAYTENVKGQAAVWTKQISTNSNIQIADPSPYDYFLLKFSPDGDWVYFGRWEPMPTLYRVPKLGGSPTKLGMGGGTVSFSPDGSQIVYGSMDQDWTESILMIANPDGSGARKLASLKGHQYINLATAAWSPDGKFIACAVGDDTHEHPVVMAKFDVATGEMSEFGQQRLDGITHSVWLNDQSGLLILASNKGNNSNHQLWKISYPEGEATQLTDDLNGYAYLSLTADSKSLVTVQRQTFGNVWLSSDGDITKVKQISPGKHEGTWGMSSAPDGRVVYVSNTTGATEIWIINPDGSGAKQLTNDGISKYTPTVTGDGRYIVFVSEKGGRHLWRMNLDGTQPVQLTKGPDDGNPYASPDGRWVAYNSWLGGKFFIWRVSIDGGEPQQLTDYFASEPAISPDGKLIACFMQDSTKWQIAIFPGEGGPPIKTLPVPQTVNIDMSPQWMPDGKGITYIDWADDVSNLWLQPVDGGPAKQLTNYTKGNIFRRAWTPDGKQVAIVFGSETSDAVMFTNFR